MKPKTRPPKSILFYDGPSLLDGARILAIATGLQAETVNASQNSKTGEMVQTWIIRADQLPTEALKSGHDASVCGACPLRPLLTRGTDRPHCYVNVGKGLQNIYRSWERGNIPEYVPTEAALLLRGRKVRLGTYGDPAALPLSIWESLLDRAESSIGYTHQWRMADRGFARLCLASVETPALREEAHALGYRTYRVDVCRTGKMAGEVVCPGSEEAGKKVTCAQCMACDGARRGLKSDIIIRPHGVHIGPRIPKSAPARQSAVPTVYAEPAPPPTPRIQEDPIRAAVRHYLIGCITDHLPVSFAEIAAIGPISRNEINRMLQEVGTDTKAATSQRMSTAQTERWRIKKEKGL